MKKYKYIMKMVLTKCVIHFSQCVLVSKCGFRMVCLETWHDTQCYIAFQTCINCLTLLLLHGTHKTPLPCPFLWPVQNMFGFQLAGGKGWHSLWYNQVPSTLPPCCMRSLIKLSWKSYGTILNHKSGG
jgi:hypothetical protein